MNSVSPGTGRKRPLRQSSLASSMRSLREETKFHRDRVAAVKAAMQQTKARPVFTSDELSFVGERHVGGEGALYMVTNAHEEPKETIGKDNVVFGFATGYSSCDTATGNLPVAP